MIRRLHARGSLFLILCAALAALAALPGAHAADPEAPMLTPGPGWTGPTPQPDPIGTGFGADAKAIARWDVVPYQTIDCCFEVGVVAFHINGIDRVEFSADNGPWVAVREMTLNPRTQVVEYWAVVDGNTFPDGPIEIRAIAYPKVGIPRVLGGPIDGGANFQKGENSMFLSANSGKTLPTIAKYVSTTGDDSTGNGTQSAPYRSIMKAARAIQDASGKGNADGGIIYLAPGQYRLGMYSYALSATTATRWLTIQPQSGVSTKEVTLNGADIDGLRTKLVRLRGLTLRAASAAEQTILVSNGPLVDFVWLDSCVLVGPGRTVDAEWSNGFSGIYSTGCAVSNCRDALGGVLVRGETVSGIGSDALTGSGLAVMCSVQGTNSSGTEFHADVMQYYSNTLIENRIAYKVTALVAYGQGFFAGDRIAIKDIAFVDCDINNQLMPQVQCAFQFGGPTEHLYVLRCNFVGTAVWRTDMAFTAYNVVVEASTFSNALKAVDGVYTRP